MSPRYIFVAIITLNLLSRVEAQDSLFIFERNRIVLTDSIFNKGNIQNPYQLIQGHFPGVLISKPGADPNGTYEVRMRGVNTLEGRSNPLVVVDGITVSSIDTIDPNDIAQIEILSGAQSARYGMQGASGVILVTTRKGSGRPFSIDYHGFISTENKIYSQRSLDREGFLALGKNDLGGETDWMEETTQRGRAFVNNLSFSGQTSKINYRAAINYRDITGIQERTGFNRLNGHANLQWSLLENLKFNYLGSFTLQQSVPGFPQVFRYALKANPTMPLRFESGDYYYPGPVFDYYNPEAILHMSDQEQIDDSYLNQLRLSYKAGRAKISAYGSSSYMNSDLTDHFPAPYPKYRFTDEYDLETSSSLMVFGGNLEYGIKLNDWLAKGGLNVEKQTYQNERNFREASIQDIRYTKEKDRVTLLATTLDLSLQYQNKWYFSFGDRLEASSALGDNKKSSHFYWLSTWWNVGNKLDFAQLFTIDFNHGKSGLTPYEMGLSQASAPEDIYRMANPNLAHEVAKNTDIGLRMINNSGRLKLSLSWYWKNVSDFIWYHGYMDADTSIAVNTNFGELANRGLEFTMRARVIQSDQFKYSTGLQLTTLASEWKDLSGDFNLNMDSTSFGRIILRNYTYIGLLEGQPFGAHFGPIHDGITPDGNWLIKDVNGDGQICFTCRNEKAIIGQAFPKVNIGWSNSLDYKNLNLSFLIRGLFGHSLMNENRLQFENSSIFPARYENSLTTHEKTSPATNNIYSDFFVEKASFVRLEYASLGYDFPFQSMTRKVYAYLAVNNLITLTKYTGNDPEPRYSDSGPITRNRHAIYDERNRFASPETAPGIDRGSVWLPSRSFTLGLRFSFL